MTRESAQSGGARLCGSSFWSFVVSPPTAGRQVSMRLGGVNLGAGLGSGGKAVWARRGRSCRPGVISTNGPSSQIAQTPFQGLGLFLKRSCVAFNRRYALSFHSSMTWHDQPERSRPSASCLPRAPALGTLRQGRFRRSSPFGLGHVRAGFVPRPGGRVMDRYVTVGLGVLAGAALIEAALIPGIVVAGAAVLAPRLVRQVGRGLFQSRPGAPKWTATAARRPNGMTTRPNMAAVGASETAADALGGAERVGGSEVEPSSRWPAGGVAGKGGRRENDYVPYRCYFDGLHHELPGIGGSRDRCRAFGGLA